MTPLYVSSFWVLVGVGVIGLPQIAVRAMSYKNSKSMHMAIIIGTLVIGTIMFGMHLIGVLARVIIPGIEIGDKVMPTLTLEILPPILAGLVLSAPMAAIMSTVIIAINSCQFFGCEGYLFKFYQTKCEGKTN